MVDYDDVRISLEDNPNKADLIGITLQSLTFIPSSVRQCERFLDRPYARSLLVYGLDYRRTRNHSVCVTDI